MSAVIEDHLAREIESYLLSNVRKIRKSQDLTVHLARAHSRDLFQRLPIDEQLLVIDAVHPFDHLAEGGGIIARVDDRGAIRGLSVQERRVRADYELVHVKLYAIVRYQAKVGELARAIMMCKSTGGDRVVFHGSRSAGGGMSRRVVLLVWVRKVFVENKQGRSDRC